MARATLVIGGTRNLGPDLVAALLARGDRVTVLNRGLTPGDLPRAVERLQADRSDASALSAALSGRSFDCVVDTTLYNGTDAEAAARILDGRAGRYVFWSTGQVYLVRTGLTPPFREADYEGPVMAEPAGAGDRDQWRYGVDKRAAEDALAAAFASRGFPVVSLRMPMINSARDHYGRLRGYVRRILAGEPILIPDDQDSLRLRHVSGDDVVTATLLAGEPRMPAGTCLNISQDDSLTIEAMLEIVARALRRRLTFERRPRGELEARGLLPGCSPWSGRWMSQLDNASARALLGMTFTRPQDYLPALVSAARSG